MSLMNDALRKRNRELAEHPVVPGFSDTPRIRRLDRRWIYGVLTAVLLTASALMGVQWIQSGSMPSLRVKTPGPKATRLPDAMHQTLAPSSQRQTPEENHSTLRSKETATVNTAETDVATPPGTDSLSGSAGSHPDIGKVSQSASDASGTITPTINEQRRHKPIAQPSDIVEPQTPKARKVSASAVQSIEPEPIQSVSAEKTGPPISRESATSVRPKPVGPAAKPIKPVTHSSIVRDTTQSQLTHQEGAPFFKKALAYHRNNRLTDAIHLYQKVLKMNPNHQGAMLNLSAAYIEQGAHGKARPLLEHLNKMAPRPKGVLLNLAITAIGTGSPTKAMDYLDAAEKAADASAYDIHFHRALAYARMNRPQDALVLYKKAQVDQPDDPLLQFNLGVTYDALERYPEALAHYEASIRVTTSPSTIAVERVTERIRTLRRYLGASKIPLPGKGQ